jgi:hypothetical protein
MKPKETAEKGQRIYDEKLKESLESEAMGKFAVIDLTTERHFLGDTPEEAIKKAKADHPHGVFYLIRIGHKGAFRLNSYMSHETDWKF